MGVPHDAAIAAGVRQWVQSMARGTREDRVELAERIEEAATHAQDVAPLNPFHSVGPQQHARAQRPLAVAYYCLHEWPEPDDIQPDPEALRSWSQSLAHDAADRGQADSVVLAGRQRVVRGASSD